jgi:hypothetical protein
VKEREHVKDQFENGGRGIILIGYKRNKETGLDWLHMAEVREKLWVLVNKVRKFLVLLRWGVSW